MESLLIVITMMDLLTTNIKNAIQSDLLPRLLNKQIDEAGRIVEKLIDQLRDNIPLKKRISFGRVYTIKLLSEYLYKKLNENNADILTIAGLLYKSGKNYKDKGVALGMLSFYGQQNLGAVLPFIHSAAGYETFNLRELAQMFFRRLIKAHPQTARDYLISQVQSADPKIRRFVAETLRPVQENRWFYQNPDYSLAVLEHLFKESAAYPRTSVGNNLSDLSRRLPELVFNLVGELVNNGDKNSYWIAYRACRNLVKNDPLRVMYILSVKEYKYKKRIYRRNDYNGN